MPKNSYHFGGYATKNGLKCTDGRTIIKDAFKGNDGGTVPLVWQHLHNDPSNVLGHALLENREDGVYAYCVFNDSESGKQAKVLVEHGDVKWLSIYANSLVEKSKNVIHGVIREVSLVLAGANPGAVIDNVIVSHGDGVDVETEDEAVIYTGLEFEIPKEEKIEEVKHEDGEDEDETIQDVFNTLSDKQKEAVYAIVGSIAEGMNSEDIEQSALKDDNKNEGDNVMKRNVFEGVATNEDKRITLTHEEFGKILADAKEMGSMKAAVLKHAGTYGIDNLSYLFPDAQTVTGQTPTLIQRDMAWVSTVINGARHTPFSRIKSVHADITVETARALGYVTGALKKEEVFALLRRITTPTTIYKKQKLDRDDIVDITDMDVVAWLKMEMRMMLDEEIARASLLSDGRDVGSEDKINETNIRPIWKDAHMYAHHHFLANNVTDANVIDEVVRARISYRGSGSPTMFVGPTMLTNWLLLKDPDGRRIYSTEAELAAALRVSSIVEVPLMDNLSREVAPTHPDGGGGVPTVHDLLCIIVNMRDYVMGADKGGQVNFFDDFDIDYNQYKYLLEGRMSGALVLPKSALVIERDQP